MICYIGLGSNLGDRRKNLERAAQALRRLRVSPIYETPALMKPGSTAAWNIPYLNAVAEIEWEGTSLDLLAALKRMERELGREDAGRWAPRVIDLDLLLFGEEQIHLENLRVPHPEIHARSFVLDPLKDLVPERILPGRAECVAVEARRLSAHAPIWMGILNITPDSFSDGGKHFDPGAAMDAASAMAKQGVQILDIGAESTRPGAEYISSEEEWRRLEPVLRALQKSSEVFRPRLSLDTRHARTAERALELGIDILNDVSGLADPQMLKLVAPHSCDLVVMHSLSVPADPSRTLAPDCDPVAEVKQWCLENLNRLEAEGISSRRVIFDPGLGFGKTPEQSREILRRFREFADLPVRLLVGHSRKSFLRSWSQDLDGATLGASLHLAQQGADILRVHNTALHAGAFRAYQELR